MEDGLPHLERFWADESGEKWPKRSVVTGKTDGSSHFCFENTETKEKPDIFEIDLDSGEAILVKKVNCNKPDDGKKVFRNIEFEFVTLDLSKYHILIK